MKRRSLRTGFTLLEVLLVIGIIVALVALVVPNLMGRAEKAKKGTTVIQMHSITEALKMFKLDIGRYPTTEEGLTALFDKEQFEDEEEAEKWDKPYLDTKVIPRDGWDNEFNYVCPGEQNEDGFDLSSNGPDELEGTEDDIRNWEEEE